MPNTVQTAKAADSRRAVAKARAASLLKIPESAIEDDLIDFVVAKDSDVLLRARAGSGKTTALGIKVAFLILDEGVDPSSVMMLAFNNAAARGLESKLNEFGVPTGVRVRTFHALAQRIVRTHFGDARRPVFDDKSDDGQALAEMMQETIDEIVNDRFFFFCASKMRTHYGKRKAYVESVGREALLSATQFLRARGYGLQNRFENAWDEAGPIGGNAMKAVMGYEIKMKEARLLDATGVLQAASWTLEREIETGNMKQSDAHNLDWIFIDEFQDVSLPYMRLVEAIRNLNGMLNVVGVGDDWQGINGFAGADLDYFRNPATYLDDPDIMDLLRNRRSGSDIVEWGNNVMISAGYPDQPAISYPGNGQGIVAQAKISAFRDLRVAAERLSKLVDPSMNDVALIARKWKVGEHGLSQIRNLVQQHLRERGFNGRVTGITAHGSKGQEFDQVLLLDDGSFPIEHPSRPILESLISDSEYLREESCLKHVAGTRARKILHHVDMKK